MSPGGARVRTVGELSRAELAVLAREYLLAGQLMDRAGMPHVIASYGREEMGQIAIEEWMGASPIYTRRTRELLGFCEPTIETLFKGLQLDIGAPPEFMDFRLRVIDERHGEFWLDHCGALMDVEPMGDDYVHTMCHTIEDPTFDATAIATDPRARIRPVHRPPRRPADRHPHCHWTATIDPAVEPLAEPAEAAAIRRSLLAARPVSTVAPTGTGGWDDYSAPLDPDLRLEVFSAPALRALLEEVGVQTHLLVMSLLASIRRRHGDEDARRIGTAHLTGSVGVTSQRLRDAFGLDGSAAALAQVLEWHPAFAPRDHVRVEVNLDEHADAVLLTLLECDAVAEPEHLTWAQLFVGGADGAVDAMARGVDPHRRAVRVDPPTGAVASWRLVADDEPHPEAPEVALTRFSTGATFAFSETPVELLGG